MGTMQDIHVDHTTIINMGTLGGHLAIYRIFGQFITTIGQFINWARHDMKMPSLHF